MCSNESHVSLSQPEHFVRHTMEVQRARAITRLGTRAVSVEDAMSEAKEALALTDDGVSTECVHMLRLAMQGDLSTAS
ncbi:MAG: hypothetical protein V4678_04060 [Patescibacteria group bacterium]